MSSCIIVPIKTFNERLPGKNTRLLKGEPLYSYLFNTLKKVECIDEIFVDCSDEIILDIAVEWGFTPLKRPEEYNANSITGDDLLMRTAGDLKFDIVSLLHVTSPFLTVNTITKAITMMNEDSRLDSVFGVMPINNRFWFEGKPINHDINSLARTQDLSPVYEESDIYFVRRLSLMKHGKRVCGRFKMIEVDAVEATDLDDMVDFIRAEALISAGLAKPIVG